MNDSGLVSGLARGTATFKSWGEGFSRSLDGIRNTFENVASRIGVLGSVMGAGVAVGLGNIITAASDMNESMSKVGVVFGQSARVVEDFAQSASTSLGISRQAALESAGTFGNLFDAMGLSKDVSAQMSVDLVRLASDLASFNNASPEEMLLKLRSGLVGEIEPLRAVGVNMNAAAVEAKAMALGLAGTSKELTESDKVMARYQLILEQTKNAQGDFARTAEGVANQMRIAKAQAVDHAAGIGSELLPIAQSLLKWGNSMLTAFQNLAPETKQMIASVVAFGGAIGAALPVVAGIASGIAALISPIGAVVAALGVLTVAYTQNFAGIKDSVDGFVKDVGRWWTTHGEEIKRIAFESWEAIQAIVAVALEAVGRVLRVAGKLLNDDWSGAWDELIKTSNLKVNAVKKEASALLTVVGGLMDIAQTIVEACITAFDAIVTFAQQAYYALTLQFDKLSGVSAAFEERFSKHFQVLRGNVQNTWIGMLHGMQSDLYAAVPAMEAGGEALGEGISRGIRRTARLPNLTLPGFTQKIGLPGFEKSDQLAGEAKRQVEQAVSIYGSGGTKAGATFGKGVGGGAKKE